MADTITPLRGSFARVQQVEASPSVRRPYRYSRRAKEIGLADSTFGASSNVRRMDTDAWILNPHAGDPFRAVATEFAAGEITEAVATYAPGLYSAHLRRGLLGLPGMAANPSLLEKALKTARRRIPTGLDLREFTLALDADSFPPAELGTLDYPLDRLIVGNVTYPANTPFIVMGYADGQRSDAICSFYFGGPADVSPESAHGGQFCLTLYGYGIAILREKAASDWELRFQFKTREHATLASGWEGIMIVPYSRNKIGFFASGADSVMLSYGDYAAAVNGNLTTGTKVYRESVITSGHTHNQVITGPGVIRYDHVRRSKTLSYLCRAVWPTSGTLVDQPFTLQAPAFAGQTLHLYVSKEEPPGTSITATLYNAVTKTPLSTNGDGDWVLDTGGQHYYLVFDLNSPAQAQTPVLYGWEYVTVGKKQSLTGVVKMLYPDFHDGIMISPVANDPARWNCKWSFHDLYGTEAWFGERAAYRFDLCTTYAADPTLYSVLFSGETARDGIVQQRRVTLEDGPYTYYEVTGTSLFARLQEAFVNHILRYWEDEYAPRDPKTGEIQAWKITDILKDLLFLCGLDDTEYDVPDLDARLLKGPNNATDFFIAPQSRMGPLILKFAVDYLEAFFYFDGNATNGGARGIWRVRDKLNPPYTPIYAFHVTPTGGSGSQVQHPDTWSANATFIEGDSFRWRISRPEANVITVIGLGEVQSANSGSMRIQQTLVNPASFNLDVDSTDTTWAHNRDGIGRAVEIVFIDPTLNTQEAVNGWCRRLYDRCAHAWEGATFTAPLALITDSSDPLQVAPRPLRQGDPVTLPNKDMTSLVTGMITATPGISIDHGDGFQWAHYECLIPDAITGEYNMRALYGLPGIELHEQGTKDLALSALGITAREVRIFAAHQLTAAQLQSVLSLPVDLSSYAPIQNQSSGALYFVPGVSRFGSTDLLQ